MLSNHKNTNTVNTIGYSAHGISRREYEVLQLMSTELTSREIANRLHISLETVSSHRKSLLVKLNVRNTAGLIYKSCKQGIL